MLRRIAIFGVCALVLCGCTALGKFVDDLDNQPELTSPCVGTEGSPCGPKRYPEQQFL